MSGLEHTPFQMPDSPTGKSLGQIRWSGLTDVLDEEKRYEVELEPEDDPQRLPLFRRWLAVATISSAAHFVTFASSVVRLCYPGPRAHITLFARQCSPWTAWKTGFMSDEKSPP